MTDHFQGPGHQDVESDFEPAQRATNNRLSLSTKIGMGVIGSGLALAGTLFAQSMIPALQPTAFANEVPDHTGPCRPYVHHIKADDSWQPQHLDRKDVFWILGADLKALSGQKTMTGRQIWDQCRIGGPGPSPRAYVPA